MAQAKVKKGFGQWFILRRRGLTVGEKRLATSVFGASLNLDSVEIIAHRLVLKNYGVSPNGNVYFNLANWCEDFSIKSLGQQSWLIHELTHVWQVQHGMRVLLRALFNRKYSYVLKEGKVFFKYGIEQQAQMVQDYFLKRAQGQECLAYEACIPFLKA